MGSCCSSENNHLDDSLYEFDEMYHSGKYSKVPTELKPSATRSAPQGAPPSPKATAVVKENEKRKGTAAAGFAAAAARPPPSAAPPLAVKAMPAGAQSMAEQMENSSLEVLLLLPSGMGIESWAKYDRRRKVLNLRNGDNKVELPIADVQKVLRESEELKKVETQADCANDGLCAALLLRNRSSCVTVRFGSPTDKANFLALVEHEIESR